MLKISTVVMVILCVAMFMLPIDTPSCGGYGDPFNTCQTVKEAISD